jgi:hypothetical protein
MKEKKEARIEPIRPPFPHILSDAHATTSVESH